MRRNELIDRLDRSIRRGDLPGAFRTQLASLREQTEAADAASQEVGALIKGLEAQIKEREALINARIKEHERICGSSPEIKANSRKHRSLKRLVHSVFGAPCTGSDWRG